jgi:hypothetical protein
VSQVEGTFKDEARVAPISIGPYRGGHLVTLMAAARMKVEFFLLAMRNRRNLRFIPFCSA